MKGFTQTLDAHRIYARLSFETLTRPPIRVLLCVCVRIYFHWSSTNLRMTRKQRERATTHKTLWKRAPPKRFGFFRYHFFQCYRQPLPSRLNAAPPPAALRYVWCFVLAQLRGAERFLVFDIISHLSCWPDYFWRTGVLSYLTASSHEGYTTYDNDVLGH